MRINKKAIINEIIVEPAKEKGFEYSWDGTKFWDKQYLANFTRTGYGQEFSIFEDFTDPGTLVLFMSGEKEFRFKYNMVDVDSFRTAIKSIQEFLMMKDMQNLKDSGSAILFRIVILIISKNILVN